MKVDSSPHNPVAETPVELRVADLLGLQVAALVAALAGLLVAALAGFQVAVSRLEYQTELQLVLVDCIPAHTVMSVVVRVLVVRSGVVRVPAVQSGVVVESLAVVVGAVTRLGELQ